LIKGKKKYEILGRRVIHLVDPGMGSPLYRRIDGSGESD
jgi:hypothetical protein